MSKENAKNVIVDRKYTGVIINRTPIEIIRQSLIGFFNTNFPIRIVMIKLTVPKSILRTTRRSDGSRYDCVISLCGSIKKYPEQGG